MLAEEAERIWRLLEAIVYRLEKLEREIDSESIRDLREEIAAQRRTLSEIQSTLVDLATFDRDTLATQIDRARTSHATLGPPPAVVKAVRKWLAIALLGLMGVFGAAVTEWLRTR